MKNASTALSLAGLLSAFGAQAASFDCAKALNADEKRSTSAAR